MARTKSSKKWLDEHFNDQFVQKAQSQGQRSRAYFKLEEMDKKDKLIQPGMTIVDLGAAPGGWSQYATFKLQGRGQVFALDILPMDPLPDVDFIQGDFREEVILNQLLAAMSEHRSDLVLSDMAPNISGNTGVDQPRAMYLVELAFELACQTLKPNGDFLVKVFQGEGFDEFLRDVRLRFQSVKTRKPQASRDRSKEVYILARNFKV